MLSLPNFFTCSSSSVAGMSGVQTGPGATQFTRIPLSATLCARALVKVWMAPLVAE
jgi:hypothetical protein